MTALRPRLRDRLCVAAFILLWIAPTAYHGLWRAPLPGEPALLHDWHDVACLFPTRPKVWNIYFVEVQRSGRREWEQLDETLDFGMEPFGHRTRLHRFLVAWGVNRDAGRREVADYLVASDRGRHPELPPIVGLRFVWTGFVPRPDDMAQGAWKRPPLSQVPRHERRVLSVHDYPGRAP